MQFIVSKKEFIPPVIAPDIIETLEYLFHQQHHPL